jgi:hypothetical protein
MSDAASVAFAGSATAQAAASASKGGGRPVAGFPRIGGHPGFSGVWSVVNKASHLRKNPLP